eukprot:4006026-Pyramimonas_sp.AAC.1
MLFSDSTAIFHEARGGQQPEGARTLFQMRILNRAAGCHAYCQGGCTFTSIATVDQEETNNFDSQNIFATQTGARCCVLLWSGHGLGSDREDRRLRGTAPKANIQRYFDMGENLLEQVRQLVELQA